MGMTNCPIECPNRRIGCRTGCPVWKQHEAKKAIFYAERIKNNEFKNYKGRVMRKAYQRIQQATWRMK
jgi:coenzyme F420-reducing hydrogenase gamma subunit